MSAKKVVGTVLGITAVVISIIAVVVGLIYIDKNNYVFKINGEKVTNSEFTTYFKLQKNMMEQEYEAENEGKSGEEVWSTLIDDAPAIETARDSAKQSIIDTKVKLQQAKKMKVALTSEEKANIRTYVNYNSSNILAAYDITLDELIKINEDAILIGKLEIELYKQTDHTGHTHGKIDIEAYEKGETVGEKTYDSRHILFKTTGMTDAEKEAVKQKAEGVLTRAKNGEDFATLANEFSEDEGSNTNGGLYTGTGMGDFVSEYENAALSLQAGEIYPELVESTFGYHIIKLEAFHDGDGYLTNEETADVLALEFEEQAKVWLENAEIILNEQQYNLFQ
ncbi:MAG: peptidylprolyl isomerase [Clostridia bacterium]|nr:peptidylprolyl isomerase [Clostridia bacterium]